jgi:hypothetical protein
MSISRLRLPMIVALLGALALTGTFGSAANLQDDGPLDLSGAVYQGPCASLNQNPTWQVGDFIPVNESNLIGYDDVGPLLRSEGTIDTTLDDLFRDGGAYSFVVRDNTDPQGDPVACGRLGGVLVSGQVVIGIFIENDANENLVGVAVFGSTSRAEPRSEGSQAQLPENVPVQAYLFVDQLTDAPEAGVTPTQDTGQPAGPTPTPSTPTSTPTPSTPTSTPTPTVTPTQAPATETPTPEPTDATDDATDATDDATDATDDATDATDDATDATDGTTDGGDGTDGTTDGTDGGDGTDGTTDGTDGGDGTDG